MRTRPLFLFPFLAMPYFATTLWAQQNQVSSTASTAAASTVPRLIKFNGTLLDEQARPMKSPVGITFALYAQQSEGAALWTETQNVETDAKGNYTVLLGANSGSGVPAELFTTGEARWLGVQPEQQAEQPRILLVSVPYALKAGDAQTLGGLPPSAFAPANSSAATNASSSSSAPPLTLISPSFAAATAPGTSGANAVAPLVSSCTTITADGTATANQVAKFTTACQIHESQLFDNGTDVGIGNGATAPAAKLDVFGTGMFRGALTLPSINTASSTTTAGFASQPFDMLASAWNTSGTPAAVSEHFRWQVQPVGSNTTFPSGSLNLLFASGAGTPAPTGLSISSKGIITFATGQTLPPISSLTLAGNVTAKQFVSTATTGTAPFVVSSMTQVSNLNASLLGGFPASHFGTITGITTAAGSGLQGGVATGNATLSLIKTCTSGQILSWNGSAWVCETVSGTGTITAVHAGTDLTGGGTAGSVTLNLDTTKVPLLASPNTFAASQTVNANITSTGVVTANGGVNTTGLTVNGNAIVNGPANGFDAMDVSTPGLLGSQTSAISASNTDPNAGDGSFAVNATAVGGIGVNGTSTSGVGVKGISGGISQVGFASGNGGAGVWGDTNVTNGVAVVGTVKEGIGVLAINFSTNTTTPALHAISAENGLVFRAQGTSASCTIDGFANLACSGSKSAVVPVNAGEKMVALYAVEAPENWFEDYGSGQLASGAATVTLDPTYAQTVNTDMQYHVFLTPNGDCKGLYVSRKSPTSFEVHELGGGTSNIAFDYRIIAKRRGYEQIRLADKTEMMKATAADAARLRANFGTKPHPPAPHPLTPGSVAKQLSVASDARVSPGPAKPQAEARPQ